MNTINKLTTLVLLKYGKHIFSNPCSSNINPNSPVYKEHISFIPIRLKNGSDGAIENPIVIKLDKETIIIIDDNELVYKITPSGVLKGKNMDFLPATLFSESEFNEIYKFFIEWLREPISSDRKVDGVHEMMLALEDYGVKTKYSFNWSGNSLSAMTIDRSLVLSHLTLKELLGKYDNPKSTSQISGHVALPLDDLGRAPWLVLTSHIMSGLSQGDYGIAGGQPGEDIDIEYTKRCLFAIYTAASEMGATDIAILPKHCTHGVIPEVVLMNVKKRQITQGFTKIPLEDLFSPAQKQVEVFRNLLEHFHSEINDCCSNGTRPLCITPTVFNVDLEGKEIMLKNPTLVSSLDHEHTGSQKPSDKPTQSSVSLSSAAIIHKVRDGVVSQDKTIALVNCFFTWDESEPDIDVIHQGIFDRYKAMGNPLYKINIRRIDLHNVKVIAVMEESYDLVTLFDFKRRPHVISSEIKDPLFFHEEELVFLENWMLDNFYH